MERITRASTKYNDLVGTAAIDFHGGVDSSLHDYARQLGIETERYFPIGLSFYIGEHGSFYLKFFCVDQQVKEVFKEENEDRVPVVIVRRSETMESFFGQIKRFEVVLGFKKSEFEPHEVYKTISEDGSES
jgi:hypothetical protein